VLRDARQGCLLRDGVVLAIIGAERRQVQPAKRPVGAG
jgi:hypothetical protein